MSPSGCILPGEITALIGFKVYFTDHPVVFDVGANVGEWAGEFIQRIPDVTMYAFEPQPEAAHHLYHKYPWVTIEQVALSNKSGGTVVMKRDEPGSYHASMHRYSHPVLGSYKGHLEVPVITLDQYCEEAGVERINFLKIDVEGNELNVLRGAERMLADGRIDMIQFEFNECAKFANVTFDDIWSLLVDLQYVLHREHPGYLERMNGYTDDDARYSPDRNFLAIHTNTRWWWEGSR